MSVLLWKQGLKYYVEHPHELPGRSIERAEDLHFSIKNTLSTGVVCKCGQVKEEWRLIRSCFCSVEHNHVSKPLLFQVRVCCHPSTASVSSISGINSRMFWHHIWHKKKRWSSSSVNTQRQIQHWELLQFIVLSSTRQDLWSSWLYIIFQS